MNIDRAEKMTKVQRELILQWLMLLEIDKMDNARNAIDVSEISYIRMLINALAKK